jgi:hypothetical protein
MASALDTIRRFLPRAVSDAIESLTSGGSGFNGSYSGPKVNLTATTSSAVMSTAGVQAILSNDGVFVVQNEAGEVIRVDGSGQISLTAGSGQELGLFANNASFTIDGSGGVGLFAASEQDLEIWAGEGATLELNAPEGEIVLEASEIVATTSNGAALTLNSTYANLAAVTSAVVSGTYAGIQTRGGDAFASVYMENTGALVIENSAGASIEIEGSGALSLTAASGQDLALNNIPVGDPGSPGAVFTTEAPTTGVPQQLWISGGL